ncbi:MAG: D-Ala-D-Ala carboxypeptidase family metallohydrolase [Bacteroidota bacterium]
MLRQSGITVLLILFLFLLTVWLVPSARMAVEAGLYDVLEGNEYVEKEEDAKAIFSQFSTIPASDLPAWYREKNGMNEAPFQKMCSKMKFYQLTKRETYQKIAGNVRLIDLLSRDEDFHKLHYFSKESTYLGIDERVVYRLIALQDALARSGYDPDALVVRFGHRHPRLNKEIGGASKSRHIVGEAIDISIDDVNYDGSYSEEDKAIVLDLCERDIIGKRGGLGRYPGTRSIHIDVRGYRARWDQQ